MNINIAPLTNWLTKSESTPVPSHPLESSNKEAASYEQKGGDYATRIYSWLGGHNIEQGVAAMQRKNYRQAIPALATAALKLGIMATAAYGMYRFVATDPIYLNNIHKQALDDLSGGKTAPEAMAKTAETLIHKYYDEQSTYKRWPKDAKDYVTQSITTDSDSAAAITTKLFEEAKIHRDNTLPLAVLKKCVADATTTKSCHAALNYVVGEPTAKPTKETQRESMRLNAKCRKSENAFCQRVGSETMHQALVMENWNDVTTIATKCLRKPTEPCRKFLEEGSTGYIKYAKELKDKLTAAQDGIKECLAGNCNPSILEILGNPWETLEAAAHHRGFSQGKLELALQKAKKSIVSQGFDIAKACLKIGKSEVCDTNVNEITLLLNEVDAGEKSAELVLTQLEVNPVSEESKARIFGEILGTLAKQNKWEAGTNFVKKLMITNTPYQENIALFWEQLLQSGEWASAKNILIALPKSHQGYEAMANTTIDKFVQGDEKLLDWSIARDVVEIGKSFTDRNGVKRPAELQYLIEKLFDKPEHPIPKINRYDHYGRVINDYDNDNDDDDYSSRYNCDQNRKIIAKGFVTNWLQSVNKEAAKPDSSCWRSDLNYDITITADNWKEKLQNNGVELG